MTAPSTLTLAVHACPAHAHASLSVMTWDAEQAYAFGTRLVGPKACCALHRQEEAWAITRGDARRIGSTLLGIGLDLGDDAEAKAFAGRAMELLLTPGSQLYESKINPGSIVCVDGASGFDAIAPTARQAIQNVLDHRDHLDALARADEANATTAEMEAAS